MLKTYLPTGYLADKSNDYLNAICLKIHYLRRQVLFLQYQLV